MTSEEIVELVSGAIDEAESKKIPRLHLAMWLWKNYQLAMKQIVVNINDGKPYLTIEDWSNGDPPSKHYVCMEKYEEQLKKEIENAQGK